MSSRSRKRLGLISAVCLALWTATSSRAANDDCCGGTVAPTTRPAASPDGKRILRISADPNNLPFSNDRREGFENKIAELIAKDLHAQVEYIWRAQRRGFFRAALKDGECDLVLGAPAGFERAFTTTPYYRSTYVFVARKGSDAEKVKSLDDPALHTLKVGVQLVGDDGSDTPPAHALAARKIIDNVVGFTLYGDYAEANPPARIVQAVAEGQVDLAIVWGPLAGYFAKQSKTPLTLTPLSQEPDVSGMRFAFSIAMGTRKEDKELHDQVNAALQRHRDEVTRILNDFNVPYVAIPSKTGEPQRHDDDKPSASAPAKEEVPHAHAVAPHN